MEKIKISVIVPVYNTQKFLNKCIKSILNQSFQDFELILVNDGSTDNSLTICENFAKKDSRIVVVSKHNEGLEKTRRVGLAHAKGEYITHVDSDDWIEKNALKNLYEAAQKSNADIVSGNFIRVIDKFGFINKKSKLAFDKEQIINNEVFMSDYYVNFFGVNIFPVSMCGKLYKKEFIDGLQVKLGGFDMGEDLNYNIQVFPHAKKIMLIDDSVYFYRFGGMTSKLNEKIISAAISMYNLKKDCMDKYHKQEFEKWILIEMVNYLKSFVKMLVEFKSDDKEYINLKIIDFLETPEIIEVIEKVKIIDRFKSDLFVKALIANDIPTMIALQTELYNKEKFTKKIKRIVSKFLK